MNSTEILSSAFPNTSNDVVNNIIQNPQNGEVVNVIKNSETSNKKETQICLNETYHASPTTMNHKNDTNDKDDNNNNNDINNCAKIAVNNIINVDHEYNVSDKESKNIQEIGLSLDGNLEEDKTISPINILSNSTCNDSDKIKTDIIYQVSDNEKREETVNNSKGNDNKDNDIGLLTKLPSLREIKPSQTIEQWLLQENQMVYPIWIGNLPNDTNIRELRHYVESKVGNVLISVHISMKQTGNVDDKISTHQYAFINMPTAEKQILCVTLLDNKPFKEEKLIVRPKRPSRFPSHTYVGNTPISSQFRNFCDYVVPEILNNPTINLNVQSVRKILANNQINLEHLPNRVWGIQCTLIPQCHRQYCSFFHSHNEKELGRIISILAAQNCGKNNNSNIASTPKSGMEDNVINTNVNDNNINQNDGDENIQNENSNDEYMKVMGNIHDISPNIIASNGDGNGENALQNDPLQLNESQSTNERKTENDDKNVDANTNGKQCYSEHTLLVQGLQRNITPNKIQEMFEIFGDIDNIIINPNHTCYLRLKRSQDARKIVCLLKHNNAGINIEFAPYYPQPSLAKFKSLTSTETSSDSSSFHPSLKKYHSDNSHQCINENNIKKHKPSLSSSSLSSSVSYTSPSQNSPNINQIYNSNNQSSIDTMEPNRHTKIFTNQTYGIEDCLVPSLQMDDSACHSAHSDSNSYNHNINKFSSLTPSHRLLSSHNSQSSQLYNQQQLSTKFNSLSSQTPQQINNASNNVYQQYQHHYFPTYDKQQSQTPFAYHSHPYEHNAHNINTSMTPAAHEFSKKHLNYQYNHMNMMEHGSQFQFQSLSPIYLPNIDKNVYGRFQQQNQNRNENLTPNFNYYNHYHNHNFNNNTPLNTPHQQSSMFHNHNAYVNTNDNNIKNHGIITLPLQNTYNNNLYNPHLNMLPHQIVYHDNNLANNNKNIHHFKHASAHNQNLPSHVSPHVSPSTDLHNTNHGQIHHYNYDQNHQMNDLNSNNFQKQQKNNLLLQHNLNQHNSNYIIL